jgi:hypothetical protein
MQANETPHQALQRLVDELEKHRHARGHVDAEHYRKAHVEVSSLLRNVPLVHGQNEIERFRSALAERRLRTRGELKMKQLDAETYLRLGDVVYTAAGVLYPDRRFAFVFAPRVEDGRKVDASPWDAGSFYRSLCSHLPAAHEGLDRREVFLAYTLPSPEYREYLVHYVTTLFRSGHGYLGFEMPRLPDPLGAICEKFTSRVFEVRLAGSVPLETWSIEKIFAPKGSGDRASLDLRSLLDPFEREKQIVWYRGASSNLQREVCTWLVQRAARAGGAHA